MKLTDNFRLEEFESRDGLPFPDEVIYNVQELAHNLQIIRNEIKVPIQINSGYRSPSHNKAIGGASKSQHLLGKAADIVVHEMSPDKVRDVILRLMKNGQIQSGGLKAYGSFTHYDIRGHYVTW